MLQSMELQTVKHDLATEQQQQLQLIQEYLEDSAGSVPGDLNKANISIKEVTKFLVSQCI